MEAGWLYLHFLDRELLTTSALYGAISFRRIQDDFVLSLLSITEPAYVSTSVLFESDYAFEIFRRSGAVFSRQDILRLAGSHEHLGGFILRKRDDYSEDRERYSRYFSDIWRDIEDRAPTLAVKPRDTTQFLHERVGQRLVALPASLGAEAHGVRARGLRPLIEHLRSTLEASGKRPVIASLFEPVFREDAAPESWRYLAALQISLAYVESYVLDYGGTIPTGLRCGLSVFDRLSRTPDTHCLNVWRELYTVFGVYPHVLTVPGEDLVRIRDLAVHGHFVRSMRKVLRHAARAASSTRAMARGARDAWSITQHLIQRLPRCHFDGSTSFVGFVEGALLLAVKALEEQQTAALETGTREARRSRLDEPAFYLDGEQGVLKSTGGWQLSLEEGVFRVLLALASDVPGVGRLGKLSDDAVATLYTGERRPRDATEAAKITYQFTRALRRRLSRAGVRDRDAIVRRLRGKGVAIGTRWASRAVRGKSEVSLVLARR